jgi:hypothetical protein
LQAESLLNKVTAEPNVPRFINLTMVPAGRAAIALASGNGMAAITDLKPALEADRSFVLHPIYNRGLAYLAASDGESAAIEFERLLARHGQAIAWPIYPLARLGLARARALENQKDRSRKAYEEFFDMWKGGDPDIPVLLQARREYARLAS